MLSTVAVLNPRRTDCRGYCAPRMRSGVSFRTERDVDTVSSVESRIASLCLNDHDLLRVRHETRLADAEAIDTRHVGEGNTPGDTARGERLAPEASVGIA